MGSEISLRIKKLFFSSRWLDYLLLSVAGLHVLAWFKGELLYFWGDWLIPLSPTKNLEHLYTWRGLQAGTISWGLGNSFLYYFFFLFEKLGLSLAKTELVYVYFARTLSGWAMYYLAYSFYPQSRFRRLFALVAACFYMFSLTLAGLIGLYVYLPYSVIPFILGFWMKGLQYKNQKIKYAFFISLASLGLMNEVPQYKMYLVTALSALIYLGFYIYIEKKDFKHALRFALITLGCWFLLYLWLVLPFSAFLQSSGLSNLVKGANLTFPDTQWATIKEELRLLGAMGFYMAALYAKPYANNPFLILSTYLVPAAVFLAFILEPKRKDVLFFTIFSAVFLILATGPNPPLGWLYKKLVLGITILKAFNTSHIMAICVSIGYAYLFASFVVSVYERIPETKIFMRLAMVACSLGLISINSWPLLNGDYAKIPVNPPDYQGIRVPSYYRELEDFFQSDNLNNFAILTLPDGPGYIQTKWGYIGGHLFPFMFSPQVIYSSMGGYGFTGKAQLRKLAIDMIKGESQDSGKLSRLLGLLNVRYIVVDKSLDMSPWSNILPQAYEEALRVQEGIRYSGSFGELSVYENKDYMPLIFIAGRPDEDGLVSPSWQIKASLDFRQINPTRYFIQVEAGEPFLLVFSQSFHPAWKAYLCDQAGSGRLLRRLKIKFAQSSLISALLDLGRRKEVKTHQLVNGYANGWQVDLEGCRERKCMIVLEFFPQRLFEFGAAVSIAVFAAGVIYIIKRRKREDGP
jgi:hypothetical protein